MKRDLDYCRQLLQEMEADPSDIKIAPHTYASDRKEMHHLDLLMDAGLITTVSEHAYRLTNDGHEFLAATRNDSTWAEVKRIAAKASAETSLDVLKDLASALMLQAAQQMIGS